MILFLDTCAVQGRADRWADSQGGVDPGTSPAGSCGAAQGGGDTTEGERGAQVGGDDGFPRVLSVCAGKGEK